MDKKQILNSIKKDYEACKIPKTKVDTAIVRWIKEYNGDKYGNEVKGRSQIVVKDVKKAIKKMAPSIIQPFIASDCIIKTKPKTIKSTATSSYAADVLNYQYNNEFDKLTFIRTIANVLPREGTIFVRTGWEYDEKEESKTFSNIGLEELLVIQQSMGDAEISNPEQNPDGSYNVTIERKVPLYNRPTAIVCKNESIFIDPNAESFKQAKFIIHEFEKSLSDLLKLEAVYDTKSNMAQIEAHLGDNRRADNALSAKRYADQIDNGQDQFFGSALKSNKKITLLEYWGEADMDGSGKAEQIVCTWIKGTDIVLRLEANPYPDGEKPFTSAVYDLEAFSTWGNSVADSISDNQKIRTAIMRGFIDNLSLSNNGQKIFRKGALDYVNMQKLLNGEKVIEVNDIEGFRDGAYNQIPQSSFNVFDMQENEIENLTGVNRNLDGIDSATIGRTSSGVQSTMSAAQRHMVILVAVIADLYKDIFTKWHAYNQVFLDEKQAFEISGDLVEMSKQDIQGQHNIEVNINVDALNQQKVQQINMLLQQSQALQGQIPPMVVPLLVSEIFSAFGKEEEAEMIKTYQPQPDPFAEQMKQLEMEEKKAQIQLIYAQAQAMGAKMVGAEAQMKIATSKADNLDVDTISKDQARDIDYDKKMTEIENMNHKTMIDAYKVKKDSEKVKEK